MEYIKFEKILKTINVSRPFDVARQIMRNNFEIFYPFMKNININKNANEQLGGLVKRFTYEGTSIAFHYFKDDDRVIFNVYRENNENKYACIILFIFPETHIAYIENISYHPTCMPSLMAKGGGTLDSNECNEFESGIEANEAKLNESSTFLLQATVAFVEHNKKLFDVNKIQLQDNSFKYCKKAKCNINMALLSTFTTGDTWYGKYGFIPYDHINDVRDENKSKAYLKNKKIMASVTVSKSNIEKHIRRSLKKLNMEDSIEDLGGLFANYSNTPISTFLHSFVKQFDSTCIIFNEFYEKFARELDIHDFHGSSFYKPL